MSVWEISELQMLPHTVQCKINELVVFLQIFLGRFYWVDISDWRSKGFPPWNQAVFRISISYLQSGTFNHKIKKIMIQTKKKYCKEIFIRLNYWCDRIHGLVREDIEKVNTMVEHIEKHTPTDIPVQVTACSLFPDTVNVPGRSS